MNTMLLTIVAAMMLGGAVFCLLAPGALRRRRFFSSIVSALTGLTMILAAMVIVLLSISIRGYKALTREDLAATVYITPLGNQQFRAGIVFPDARDTAFAIAGDEFYIDARIIKWKPIVNLLGLHTAYRLDRVSGRYLDIQDETSKVRTLYSIGGHMKPWDLFYVRSKCPFLAPILDAEYGSATFVPVKNGETLRIMVTTGGLMVRPGELPEK